jgi:hypothetical protein
MRLAGHVVRIGETRNSYILVENLNGNDYFGDQGVDGRILLPWILRKQEVRMWTGFIWLGIGRVVSSVKHGIEPLSSIKGGEFLG